MAIKNGILLAPISTLDVAKCLGVSSLDVGTLCTSTKVNKWAKYKPVSYPSINPTNGEQWRGDANSTLWGMLVDIINNAESANGAKDAYEGSFQHYNYVHNRPVGGIRSPYRLVDFCGYYHKAKGITIQGITKDTMRVIYVSNTATSTEQISYSVRCGGNKEEVKFSDIEEVAKDSPDYFLRLVISLYEKGTENLIGEYFNNGIKLYEYTDEVIDDSYDVGETHKAVSISFKKDDFWGNSMSEIDVYLSFQTIRKEVTPEGNFYHADKIIALPYSENSPYKESIRFSVAYRYIRATKIHMGATASGTRNWETISPSNPFNYPGLGTPDIMFEVSKMPDEVLRFENGVCFLRSRHTRRDGKVTIVSGILSSESGSGIPSYVEVPTGVSGVVNVYYHFGDMLQEPEYYNGQKLPSGGYHCEISLVKVENEVETETPVATVVLYINVRG